MAQEAVGDGVAATPRGSHGSHKLGVNDLLEGTWRPPFIPSLQANHAHLGSAGKTSRNNGLLEGTERSPCVSFMQPIMQICALQTVGVSAMHP